jgi:hypothetical protein
MDVHADDAAQEEAVVEGVVVTMSAADDERKVRERRAAALKYYREVPEPHGPILGQTEDVAFTCDDCGAAATCEYAFDLYNTDGDCLAEK